MADNHPAHRQVLCETLSAWGAETREAQNGHEALAEIERCRDEMKPFHLMFLDTELPGLTGFEVLRTCADRRSLEGATVIMLTADPSSADIAESYNLGLGGYLSKPVRRADLKRAIDMARRRSERRGACAHPEDSVQRSTRPLRILMADDSVDNRLLIQAYLQKTAHRLETAEDGKLALEKHQDRPFDLILMDLQMPVMDGYAATQAIRQWEYRQQRRPVPIVALTAHAMHGDADRSLAAGCSMYLTKPIKKATLLNVINTYARDDRPVEEKPEEPEARCPSPRDFNG